jgi:hypothetical protein
VLILIITFFFLVIPGKITPRSRSRVSRAKGCMGIRAAEESPTVENRGDAQTSTSVDFDNNFLLPCNPWKNYASNILLLGCKVVVDVWAIHVTRVLREAMRLLAQVTGAVSYA